MIEFFRHLFDSNSFVPHGASMLWQTGLIWLHAASDLAIALAFYSISAALVVFVRRRRDLVFPWIFLLFGLFLFACGTTQLLETYTLWHPVYRLSGFVKALTALVSVATAVVLWPLISRAVALPSPAALRLSYSELEREVHDRRVAEENLRKHREHLEALIEERAVTLKEINRQLIEENQERRQAERELALARDLAEQASRAKTQFLANMSHELRTPLNAIIGFSEVLEDGTFGPLNERQTRYVSNILTSGRDLLQLINDVLDLSKIEAGRMELEPAPFNVGDALHDIQRVVKALATKKHIDLTIKADPIPPVTADQPKFKQIMYNLLSNGVKFTPPGGTVHVKASMVTEPLDGDRAADVALPSLRVVVSDTGIGIAPEDHERVFEEFEQLDSSFQRMHEGSGLGLALTRKLVELHGGRIWVESQGAGQGSTFVFVWPMTAQAVRETRCEDEPQIISPVGMTPSPDGGQPPVVLVVEDDPHARELLTHYLCSAGYAVAHAGDGEEALRVARELKPVAITLDVLLPRKDGWQVLRELKSSPDTEQTPAIIVSITKDARLGFSLGAVEYLVKPVNRNRLVAAVRRVAAAAGKKALTVLVVDDEAATVEVLSSALRLEGHRVLAAASGSEGVELAIHHLPDAIVLDLNMPVMSGFEVVQRLREHAEARKIPVFVYTARDLSVEERTMLSHNVEALVPKSAREELLQVLASLREKKLHG